MSVPVQLNDGVASFDLPAKHTARIKCRFEAWLDNEITFRVDGQPYEHVVKKSDPSTYVFDIRNDRLEAVSVEIRDVTVNKRNRFDVKPIKILSEEEASTTVGWEDARDWDFDDAVVAISVAPFDPPTLP